MIPAVAQPAFLQAFRPAVHTLRARDPDGSHASRPLSRLLRRGFADVLLICPDTPPAFTVRALPRCVSSFRSSTTATRHPSAAEARTRGRERRESLSLFQQRTTAARRISAVSIVAETSPEVRAGRAHTPQSRAMGPG